MMQTLPLNSLEQLAFLSKLDKAKQNTLSRSIWQPDPDNTPQCLAYELADKVDELGYGGQAGGGKTELILGLAGTKFKRSLILRREFPQLQDIVDRGNELYPADFVGGIKRRWEFADKVITLGSMQHEKDWRKYKGRARDLLGFDESAEFPEDPVRKVTGWTRSAPGVKTLVVYAFNPPTTPEGQWIIEYFKPWLDPTHPNPAQSGEIRWFAYLPDERGRDTCIEVDSGDTFEHEGKTIYPISRTFIAASRHNNKYLDKEYERRLGALPEPLRSMIRDGDMTVSSVDHPWQVIPTAWIVAAQERWLTHKPHKNVLPTALAVDVARGGADDTVIAKLYGTWFDELVSYVGELSPNGQTVRDQVLNEHQGRAVVGVDVVGYGSSPYDFLKEMNLFRVVAINGGASGHGTDASGKLKFFNLRARMYWMFREALDPNNNYDIALPPSLRLRKELATPHFSVVKNVIKIERKEDVKKRLGHSPDYADVVVMAWEIRDYDPYDDINALAEFLGDYRGQI